MHLPLLLPAMGAAGLLVFVDAMRNCRRRYCSGRSTSDTLATHVYGLTALEQFERAALGALAIVIVGTGAGAHVAPDSGGSRPGSGSG